MRVDVGGLFNRIDLRYARQVADTYAYGTYRVGPMHNISIVGTTQEECGAYMPQLVKMIEEVR